MSTLISEYCTTGYNGGGGGGGGTIAPFVAVQMVNTLIDQIQNYLTSTNFLFQALRTSFAASIFQLFVLCWTLASRKPLAFIQYLYTSSSLIKLMTVCSAPALQKT